MGNRIAIELLDGVIGYTTKENKEMIEKIQHALAYIDCISHSNNVTDNAYYQLNYVIYEAIENNEDDYFVANLIKNCVAEVKKASRYCGYYNIQYATIKAVNKILE